MFDLKEFQNYLRHTKQADEEFENRDHSVVYKTPHEKDVTYKFFMEDIYHYLLTFRAYRRYQKDGHIYYVMNDEIYNNVVALINQYYPEYGKGLLQKGTKSNFDNGVHN